MDEAPVWVALVAALLGTGCATLALLAWPAAMIALPFWYRSTWRSWTQGRTAAEAYEAVAVGATRGLFQIRPASWLYEAERRVQQPPDAVIDLVAEQIGRTMTLSVLGRDPTGVCIDWRWPPELGPGWVVVVRVDDDGGESVVRVRARSTFAIPFPVLGFFLSLQIRLHLWRILLG